MSSKKTYLKVDENINNKILFSIKTHNLQFLYHFLQMIIKQNRKTTCKRTTKSSTAI